jgi:predicted dehydrogenase
LLQDRPAWTSARGARIDSNKVPEPAPEEQREQRRPGETVSGDRRLRVGVLGAGPIAQAAHLEAIQKAANAELHAICEAAPDLLERMAAIYLPTHAHTDYAAMLADPQLEAVVVAIADQFHVPAAEQALRAGKHVLVEKPLGVSVAEAAPLRDLVRETGLVLQLGTMRRFDEGIRFAHDFIRTELGELVALKAWYCDSSYRYTMTDALQPVVISSNRAWRPPGDPKADRSRYYLLGHGSHLLDTALFLGGEITRVSAHLVRKAGMHSWFVACDFAGGAHGQLDLTMAVRMDWHEGFQVYGDRGSVLGRTFLPWHLRTSEVEAFSVRDGRYRRPLGPDGHFWRRQMEGFADTILKGAPQRGAGVEDGLAVLAVLEAIERSQETGAAVTVGPGAGAGA